ncbi:glycosyltransferase family 2 protein [Actinopolyspora mortivallis]|uniref:Glycosyl transferase n=1 Tax=Actinopolyspora mortivallis TaxID=33906 RepID=A0A2T0GU64_ACTMO|nr:glycosyltransferase family 2 protein [Actinopolyspora mortivallis]PRW62665.1 glycosyl transferase [Actinopolyspora mortivallis]
MNPGPKSTVVVVTWRGRAHVGRCLDALRNQRPHRLLVVDNASDDGTAGVLAEHPSRPEVLRLPRNLGYAGGVQRALGRVETEYVAWLNDDARPDADWLDTLEAALDASPEAAAAASLLYGADGTVSRGVRLTATGHGADTAEPQRVFGFCGGAVLLRTAVLREVGGVPASFFCYYEDTDTSWRLRLAGHEVLPTTAGCAHTPGTSSAPGSARFHLWNERNRLVMLLRCAPARIALREVLRFGAVTAALPLRRLRGAVVPEAANFRVPLRLRVLGQLFARFPRTLRQRRRVAARSVVDRRQVWNRWSEAGRHRTRPPGAERP